MEHCEWCDQKMTEKNPGTYCDCCGLTYCRQCREEPEYGSGFDCPEPDCNLHPVNIW